VSLLRAPLLQFFLLGALLLLAHRALRPPPPNQIQLTAEAQAGFEQDFQRRNGRPPSADERQSLRDAYLNSEVLYREALSRHLDRGDVIIRRRLVQKMEFVLDALAGEREATPGDQAVAEYFAQHAQRYRLPARISLVHVFLATPSSSGTQAQAAAADQLSRARSLRQRLLRGADPATLGDPFVRGARFDNQSSSDLAAVFGPAFAAAIERLPSGSWSEPIASSYGLHLVQITATEPARLPPLPSIRARVENDLREEQRQNARRELLRDLRQSYDIVQP
jgi:hypothetical protein